MDFCNGRIEQESQKYGLTFKRLFYTRSLNCEVFHAMVGLLALRQIVTWRHYN
jgi:hypothetical protein